MNVPERIPPYEMAIELGRGLNSRVWLAYDESTGTQVAIKLYQPGFWSGQALNQVLPGILKAVALLNHPALVAVEDVSEADGQVFLVLPYLEGGTLADRLRQGPFSEEDAYWVVTQVAAGLGAAHNRGIYHLNLKPSDILYDLDGVPYLAGVGLAQALAANPTQIIHPRSESLVYASPERALGWEGLGPESDVYALAALTWHMLTGSPPYPREDPLEAAMDHILEENLPAPPAGVDLPQAVFDVLRRAMRKDPWERYPTMRSFAADLGASMGFEVNFTEEITTEIAMALQAIPQEPEAHPDYLQAPPPPPRKRRRWLAWSAATLLVLAALALLTAGFLAWQYPAVLNQALAAVGLSLPTFPVPPPASTATQPAPTTAAPTTAAPMHTPTTGPAAGLPPDSTNTPVPPTPTSEATPPGETPAPVVIATTPPLILGGADRIAFLNQNEIFIANVDGSDLIQITDDKVPKSSLEWTPDGKYLLFRKEDCYFRIAYDAITSGSTPSERIGCYEDIEYSPDMSKLVVGGRIYGDFTGDIWWNHMATATDTLLVAGSMTRAQEYSGCSFRGGRLTRFSQTGSLMAAVFESASGGRLVEIVRVFQNTNCSGVKEIKNADSFPESRFTMRGYSASTESPLISDYAWDGDTIFILHGNILQGFGEMVIYNTTSRLARIGAPVDNACCYREISFSPDGTHLVFIYRDISKDLPSKLYYIPFGAIDTGQTLTPLDLPFYFFTDPHDPISPALRPAK